MADIAPFRAIRYNPQRAGELALVVSPPYDVLSEADQEKLYQRSLYNVVRIILNRPEDGDGPLSRYQRAAATMQEWLKAGVLMEDPEPALYVYRQQFANPATTEERIRMGLVCALRLTPFDEGTVLPHEYTKPAAKADRLELLRATRTNTEAILALYEDPDGRVTSLIEEALERATLLMNPEADGMTHEVHRIAETTLVKALTDALAQKRLWIADGHHRYETALQYRDELRRTGGDAGEAERILVTLVAFEDEGLVVLPTHRVLQGLTADGLGRLLTDLRKSFDATKLGGTQEALALAAETECREGTLVLLTREGAWRLHLRNKEAMAALAPERGPAWRSLDVSILQTLVLEPLAESGVTFSAAYTQSAKEAAEMVSDGAAACAFLMGSISADTVRAVTSEGDRMPPKSTYFYPKLWSGLFMRRAGP